MAEIITIPVGPLEVNCYLIWDEETREGIVIDPGGDEEEIKKELRNKDIEVKYIVNTHGHFDHVGGDAGLKSALRAPVAIHALDATLLEDAHEHGVIFGVKTPKQPTPDMLLVEGMELSAGKISLKVIHTPGHTRGGVCLYSERDKVLFTGDTLFAGSVGRTDFEGGSMDDLMKSINEKILPLGDDVRVLPGHGPDSTIGEEKEINPFIAGMKKIR